HSKCVVAPVPSRLQYSRETPPIASTVSIETGGGATLSGALPASHSCSAFASAGSGGGWSAATKHASNTFDGTVMRLSPPSASSETPMSTASGALPTKYVYRVTV